MTDTRCANPEDQLDVDIMVVEYVVYHAIEAKLKSLKQDLMADGSQNKDLERTSARLIHIFDTLIRLFKHNHPKSVLSEGTTFNIKILEFLVLFGQLGCTAVVPDRLNEARVLDTTYRRRWLDLWSSDPNGPGTDIKSHIDTNEEPPELDGLINLTDILVRFMDLSAELANAMGRVNNHWYKLAAEFTLQCAVERLQLLVYNKSLHGPDPSHLNAVVTWLSECFAWGIQPGIHASDPNHKSTTTQNQKLKQYFHEQNLISAIFQTQTGSPISNDDNDDDDGDTHMPDLPNPTATTTTTTEDPSWTKIRTKRHLEILQVLFPSTRTCDHRLKDLRRRHPLDAFLLELHKYIEGAWCLNADSISGKPALVQIEEGGIDGLSVGEFGEFLGRVGLKASWRGGDGEGSVAVRWMR